MTSPKKLMSTKYGLHAVLVTSVLKLKVMNLRYGIKIHKTRFLICHQVWSKSVELWRWQRTAKTERCHLEHQILYSEVIIQNLEACSLHKQNYYLAQESETLTRILKNFQDIHVASIINDSDEMKYRLTAFWINKVKS